MHRSHRQGRSGYGFRSDCPNSARYARAGRAWRCGIQHCVLGPLCCNDSECAVEVINGNRRPFLTERHEQRAERHYLSSASPLVSVGANTWHNGNKVVEPPEGTKNQIRDPGSWIQGPGSRIRDTEYRIPRLESQILDPESRIRIFVPPLVSPFFCGNYQTG